MFIWHFHAKNEYINIDLSKSVVIDGEKAIFTDPRSGFTDYLQEICGTFLHREAFTSKFLSTAMDYEVAYSRRGKVLQTRIFRNSVVNIGKSRSSHF